MSGIVMYGAPPIDNPWPSPDIQPFRPLPNVPRQPFGPAPPSYAPVDLSGTMAKDGIVQTLSKRIDWLREQLANADAWREELATLERMLAATKLEPSSQSESKEQKP